MGKFLFTGVWQGIAAWCAYALVEFVFSSVLFAIVRPYTAFTPWHWRLTGLLLASYVAAGALAGAVAALAAWGLGRRRPRDVQAGATLVLTVAFLVNVAANPLMLTGKFALVAVAAGFAVLLAAAMLSERWAGRLGLLTNPWVVSGLLLGLGQQFGLLQIGDSARTMGAKIWVWAVALGAVWLAVAAGSVVLGRRLNRSGGNRLILGVPNFAAASLALLLLVSSVWLGAESPVRAENISPRLGTPQRPNVIVLVMDTVRADHLGVYGYARQTTPNLSKLAAESTVYTRALAPSDMTLASHASLFTGLYPSWHGAYCRPPEAAYGHELVPQATTLAETLAKRGYLTLGVSANVYLRPEFGLQRGFREFRIPRPLPLLPSESYWYLLRTGMRRALSRVTDTSQIDRLYSRGEDVNKEAFALLGAQPPSQAPLFLFLNYMDAHFPYIPPAPFDTVFPGKNRRLMQEDMERTSDRVVDGEPMSGEELRHRTAQYDGGIAYIDAQIGQLVDWLKQRSFYDNTLLVVTSDHGEAFGEKQLVLHANSAYQNLVHVPLLVKYPRQAHAGRVEEPVSLVDVMPTILEALGEPVPGTLQGRSLLGSRSVSPRELYAESFPCPSSQPPECRPAGCMQRAVYSWPRKLITSSSGKRELYDLDSDPDERSNLYAKDARAKELVSELGRWTKTMPARVNTRTKMDEDAARQLKSLGYIQ